MHASPPVRYLGDIPLVKLATAVGHDESDSRRSRCRSQKPIGKLYRRPVRGNADHSELPAVEGISMPSKMPCIIFGQPRR